MCVCACVRACVHIRMNAHAHTHTHMCVGVCNHMSHMCLGQVCTLLVC